MHESECKRKRDADVAVNRVERRKPKRDGIAEKRNGGSAKSNGSNAGEPSGDITVWDEILFPFDPALAESLSLEGTRVERYGDAAVQQIEEKYTCDSTGRVTVSIRNTASHYGRGYPLSKWSGKTEGVKPSGKKRKR